MVELYRIHFGFSRSKRYPQAIELAQLANQHQILGEGDDAWHIVTTTEDQVNLMASLYISAKSLGLPRIHGANILSIYLSCSSDRTYNRAYASKAYKERVRTAVEKLQQETGKSSKDLAMYLREKYLNPIREDMAKVQDRLKRDALIDHIDHRNSTWVRANTKPEEPITIYKQIRERISGGRYTDAIDDYYAYAGNRYYTELIGELIYLKHLAKIPLTGRDLLNFRSDASRDELISTNLAEYVDCIDEALTQLEKMGRKSPLDILLEYAPTMEKMIEDRERDWNKGVYLWGGEFRMNSSPITLNNFSTKYDACPEGRLFDRYPDQVQHCRIIEYPPDTRYVGLWTLYSPSCYQTEILDKGLHLNGIEAYRHKSWKRGKREPGFSTVASIDEIEKSDYGTKGISYTGCSHNIGKQEFYEVNLLRVNADRAKYIGNPFIELIEEILREAENLLRDKHGIPKIGEGWVSEMKLYDLVKAVFPEVQHHAIPEWLKPQHLDVFVSSRKLAFEYQGKQHLEVVDFFGGQTSFESTVNRDRLKAKKCKAQGIILIPWLYTERIDQSILMEKLRQAGVRIP
jgi:hypothetical protein